MTDLDQPKAGSKISRRTVAKGAAWTLPVVSLAAAAPTASASTAPCEGCFSAGNGPLTGTSTYTRGVASITVTGGVTNGCGSIAFAFAGTGATVTFADGTTATTDISGDAGTGAGALTAFSGAALVVSAKTITKVCFDTEFTVTVGGSQSKCDSVLCWTMSAAPISVGSAFPA